MSQVQKIAILSAIAASGMGAMGASAAFAIKAQEGYPMPSLGSSHSRGKGKGTASRRYGNDCNNGGRFVPHQNTRECNRRMRQMEKAAAKAAKHAIPLKLAA